MTTDLGKRLEALGAKLGNLGGYLDLPEKAKRTGQLEQAAQHPDFWKESDRAQRVLKELGNLKEQLTLHAAFRTEIEDQRTLLELAREAEDEETLREVDRTVKTLEQRIGDLEIRVALSEPHDRGNAILSINPGAGGTESQDWAQMLLRMYLRWCEGKGFKTQVLDLQPGEEAGIKGAVVSVVGAYAYGYLKAEVGVHRLVRISPFDASRRRHTSFASVAVLPEVEEVEVDINEKDLRIDTFRASGHGGQHVNVTDSAVRITHVPTGTVVSCQNERSQHKNRALAMKVLRSRLYEHFREKREKEMQALAGEKKEIAWGSQIRSYVLAPYQLVKDHRTGVETGNVEAVLNGGIDQLVDAYLFHAARRASS
ncbi:MAG: peptide chain release factor 2 [candidate division NC10 bacterium]|nr:peptide chain release factor 2 [candidate division NC10 bacterium]